MRNVDIFIVGHTHTQLAFSFKGIGLFFFFFYFGIGLLKHAYNSTDGDNLLSRVICGHLKSLFGKCDMTAERPYTLDFSLLIELITH